MTDARQWALILDFEIGRHIGRAAGSRLNSRSQREIVRKSGDTRLPDAVILRGAVHQHQRSPFAYPLVGTLEPVRPDDLHAT